MCKKLRDPTACRLENFWWHIWGSDRRNLSGETIARLWKDIASGPTFVPLMGPRKQYQGPSVGIQGDVFISGHWTNILGQIPHTQSMHESDQTGTTQSREAGTSDEIGTSHPRPVPPQNLTPSSSRPPPPHPILKKPRGPSSSGPRPTARFVDVPDSEDENAQQSSSSQQSASGASQSDSSARNPAHGRSSPRARSPAKQDRKPAATKKFVASTTASKRRPVLPRRQSSQSSTGSISSDRVSRDATSCSREQFNQQAIAASPQEDSLPSRRGSLPTHVEEPQSKEQSSDKRPNNEPSPEKPTIIKTSPSPDPQGGKKASKRTPSPLSQGHNAQRGSPKKSGASSKARGKQPESTVGSAEILVASHSNPLGIYDSTAAHARVQTATSKGSPVRQPDTIRSTEAHKKTRDANPKEAPSMVRSKSNTEAKRASSGPISTASFKSPSVVGMSKFAVSGGFDFETPRPRPSDEDLPPLAADQPDIRKSSVLDSKFCPTQPSPTPAPPMGRSKSQLTLLLERDKARIGDRHKVGSGTGSNSVTQKDDGSKKS